MDELESIKNSLAAHGYDLDEDGYLPPREMEPGVAKEEGNKMFKAGKYETAIRFWKQGAKAIMSKLCAGPEAMADRNLSELDLTINLNIAMAMTKLGDFQGCILHCNKALMRRADIPEKQLGKALYRRAAAERSLGRLAECIETLKDLLSVEESPAGRQMLNEVEREYALQIKKQKLGMQQMWNKLKEDDVQLHSQQEELERKRIEECGAILLPDEEGKEALARWQKQENQDLWDRSFSSTFAFVVRELARDGRQVLSGSRMVVWFLGASSACELMRLSPEYWAQHFPNVKQIDLVLVGFCGQLLPDGATEPDAGRPEEDGVFSTETFGDQTVTLHCYRGLAQDIIGPGCILDRLTDLAPTFVVMAHPHLHRYFDDWFHVVRILVSKKVPTLLLGGSDPDPSWAQDEDILQAMGCRVVLHRKKTPYPMIAPPNIQKNHHVIVFQGGSPQDDKATIKVNLLGSDVVLVGGKLAVRDTMQENIAALKALD